MGTRVNATGQIRVLVESFGLPERFSELKEIALYRIIQEWVNNVLKYANAKSVTIQLVGHENEVTLTIEDDGAGFDKRKLEDSLGNGWINIQSRIKLIKATVEIDSQPDGKGTTFIVSMPWKKQ